MSETTLSKYKDYLICGSVGAVKSTFPIQF